MHFTDHVINEYTVEHQRPGDGRVQESIRRLAPHGSTNVQAGLNLGVELADQARQQRPDAYNYVVLMSDGVANVDATNPFAILETAYDADAGNPAAPHRHRRGHQQLQRCAAGAVGAARQRLVSVSERPGPGAGHFRPRQLAGAVHPLCRPDPAPRSPGTPMR